jgi:hypothetical protein
VNFYFSHFISRTDSGNGAGTSSSSFRFPFLPSAAYDPRIATSD